MTNRYNLPEGCPKHSPWGSVDYGERIADGVYWVGTPSHGGYRLSTKMNLKIPEAFRREDRWYEEDCDWAIVVFFLTDIYHPANFPDRVARARKSLRAWHWRQWQTHFGEEIPPAESRCKAEAKFIEDHCNDLLVTAAFGDWNETVPKGMVGVIATIQGSREPYTKQHHFLVAKDEYDTRSNNPGGYFVIDPTRHQTWKKEG